MMRLYDVRFSLFTIFDILGICLCAFLLKKFVRNFPHKLIPIMNVCLSLLTTFIYLHHHRTGWPVYFLIVTGITGGLAATGLHQVFKQTRIYLTIKYYLRQITKIHK